MEKLWDAYLSAPDKATRLASLQVLREAGASLPISLSEDLLCMSLDPEEKAQILDLSASSDKLELEHFLTQGAGNWEQNLAALALRKWVQSTERFLWFRLLALAASPIQAQRIRYTILDLCPYTHGAHLLKIVLQGEGLKDSSPAFQGLLFDRSVQWSFEHPQLWPLIERCWSDLHDNLWPDHKALPAAAAWLLRFAPDELAKRAADAALPSIWRNQLRLMVQASLGLEALESSFLAATSSPQCDLQRAFRDYWPHPSLRHRLQTRTLVKGLELACGRGADLPAAGAAWELFAGFSVERLSEALCSLDALSFARAIHLLQGLLPTPPRHELIEQARAHLVKGADPHQFLADLSPRFRLALNPGASSEKSAGAKRWQDLLAEEADFVKHEYRKSEVWKDYGPKLSQLDPEESSRKEFFQMAYRGKKLVPSQAAPEHFWGLLSKNWYKPQEADLSKMATLARQAPKLFHSCYLHTLARFTAKDAAALKLLDYIRTNNEGELQEVIQALAGIGTPRALQELIAVVTRPNITPALQWDVCQILRDKDLRGLQGELRSAIADLNTKRADGGLAADVRDSLLALLSTQSQGHDKQTPEANPPAAAPRDASAEPSEVQGPLDEILRGRITCYDELSSEVRRALRTAQFFYSQVEKGKAAHAIDLSPVIDMQYKALELIFRECFEEPSFRLINQGVLQRKLDVIGYARPIPKAMDEFETYIGSLPVIKDIPFFSKFKLRKMLRAICQYRPGKRFTLDGIKAFALFFLCFARKRCPYGLNEALTLGFQNDLELAEFCRLLHVFQDLRNRAAHEGFRPEARNDMEGVWQHTAQIIASAYKLRLSLTSAVR